MSRRLDMPDGSSLALDEKGYLLDRADWSPRVAEVMAAADSVDLTEEHWRVIRYFQEYYEAHDMEPPMRALVRKAAEFLEEDRGSSRYLYRLFPDGPTTQACRYAGLPRPVSCL